MLTTLVSMTAFLSLVLLGLLFTQTYRVLSLAKLFRYRSQALGLGDLLNHGNRLAPGVVLGKNGSLMAGWIYTGEDDESKTVEARNAVVQYINAALADYAGGWMAHCDVVRERAPVYAPAAGSCFSDPVTAAIDEERRQYFESQGAQYKGYFVLVVTWLPSLVRTAKLDEWVIEDANPQKLMDRTQLLIAEFEQHLRTLSQRLSAALRLQRLDDHLRPIPSLPDAPHATYDGFLQWVHYCVTGLTHPIAVPPDGAYLDPVLATQELWGGIEPRIGRKHIRVVAIESYPDACYPGILAALNTLPCEYRWSNRFIFLDPHESVRLHKKFQAKWKQKVRGLIAPLFQSKKRPDLHANKMANELDELLQEIESRQVASGYHTSVVILMDEDAAQVAASAEYICSQVSNLGFPARIETGNTLEAWLGSIPGHGYQNITRPPITSDRFAALIASSTLYTGLPYAPNPRYPPNSPPLFQALTTGATPFWGNCHVRDSELGSTLILGPTRTGKSVLLALLIAQLRRYPKMCVFAFDKGYSLYTLAAAIRASTGSRTGLHYDFDPSTKSLGLCPLHDLATASDRSWAADWLETLLTLAGLTVSIDQRNEIKRTLVTMDNHGHTRLGEFAIKVQDKSIRAALEPYLASNGLGRLFNAATENVTLSDFTVFEIEELMGLGEKYVLPVLLYLFRRIERRLDGVTPVAIVIDEAWVALGHPVFRDKLAMWLRTLAKNNCFVILATQEISDVTSSGIVSILNHSCPTKICLPNSGATSPEEAALYAALGLNERQVEIIAGATPRQQYYIVQPEGARLVELALGPLALALLAKSGNGPAAEIKALEEALGPAWLPHWLEQHGVIHTTERAAA